MEILIAILWYISVLFTNTTYTYDEVYAMEQANQAAIEMIESDPVLLNEAITTFNGNNDFEIQTDYIEVWDKKTGVPPKG